jgi:hypothetical protein
MNALARFYRRGTADADRRVAAALAPVRTDAIDRYLSNSRFVMAMDGATRRLRDWWLASATGRAASLRRDALLRAPLAVRYRTVAVVVLTAAIAHVSLMLIQGPRPGWFWIVIPAMAAAFALLVLAGSRSARSAA